MFASTDGSDLGGNLGQAVPTEWHVAFTRPLTGECHRQRPRDGADTRRATSAWTIFESCAAVNHEAGDPTADRGSTHPFLLGHTTRSTTCGTAQDQTSAPRQALCGGASSHPALQLTLLRGSQVDPRRGTRHRQTPSFFPARWPTLPGARVFPEEGRRTHLDSTTAPRCTRTWLLAHCRACP